MPRRVVRYPGWEANAPWRVEAAERIELLRKGDFTVVITNAASQPVPGAKVSVRMKRHTFGFGSAVVARRIAEPGGEDNACYRKTIETCFNKVVFENNFKWAPCLTNRAEEPVHRERTLQAIEWLLARGIAIRGHVLVWPSWQNVPAFLRNLKDDPTALRRAVDEHIADQTSVLRGKLKAFGRAMGRINAGQAKPKAVRAFLAGGGAATRNWICKWTTLRGFYRFAMARRLAFRSPLPERAPKVTQSFTPYICSRS